MHTKINSCFCSCVNAKILKIFSSVCRTEEEKNNISKRTEVMHITRARWLFTLFKTRACNNTHHNKNVWRAMSDECILKPFRKVMGIWRARPWMFSLRPKASIKSIWSLILIYVCALMCIWSGTNSNCKRNEILWISKMQNEDKSWKVYTKIKEREREKDQICDDEILNLCTSVPQWEACVCVWFARSDGKYMQRIPKWNPFRKFNGKNWLH